MRIDQVGIILGGNFLWWKFSGWELSGGNHLGGNFPGGSFHVTKYLMLAKKYFFRRSNKQMKLFC